MKSAQRAVPGPDSHPVVQGTRYFRNPLTFLDECATRYGDLFALSFPGSPQRVCLQHPEDLKAVYGGDPELLHAGEAAGSVFAPLTGWGCTLTLDGAAHAERRALVQSAFQADRFPAYRQIISEVAQQWIAGWPRDGVFPLHQRMRDLTLRVIFRIVLGLDDRDPAQAPLLALVGQLAALGMGSKMLLIPALRIDAGRLSPWGRILRIVRDTDALLLAEIAGRRGSGRFETGADVLSILMRARGAGGRQLNDRELRDEAVALLIAGHETTAVALTWVAERILACPEVEARLRDELEPARSGDGLDLDRVEAVEYLDAVIKESLRFWALSPICGGRVLKAPLPLRGHLLPPETVVVNCPYLLHKREDVYPEAQTFRPERFLGQPPAPSHWTTFGGGARRCLGRNLALLEMKVTLALLLTHTRLGLVGETRPQAEGIHLLPAKGLPVRRLA